jgi:hypothetical protein
MEVCRLRCTVDTVHVWHTVWCLTDKACTPSLTPPPSGCEGLGNQAILCCSAFNWQAIQHYGRLEKISIYNNAIGSAGCKALTEAVQANRNLKVVEFLPGNCAPTRDIKLLAQAVKQNRRCARAGGGGRTWGGGQGKRGAAHMYLSGAARGETGTDGGIHRCSPGGCMLL